MNFVTEVLTKIMQGSGFAALDWRTVIMLLIAFGAGRQTLRTGLLFLAAVCAFAGAAVLAAQLFGTGVLVLPGGTFYAVSVLGLLLLAGLLYMLCYTIFSCTAQHGGEIRTMTLLYGGNRVPVRALHDTGCTLRDPMTGERVLVAEADALRALLPRWSSCWAPTTPRPAIM